MTDITRTIAAQLALTQECGDAMFYAGQLSIIPQFSYGRVNLAERRKLMAQATAIVTHDRILTGRFNLKYGADENERLLQETNK